jgi:hypothetical protein
MMLMAVRKKTKVSHSKAVDLKAATLKKAKEDVDRDVMNTPCARVMDGKLADFFTSAEKDWQTAFEKQVATLDMPALDNILKTIAGSSGGTTEFKLAHMSHDFFGKDMAEVIKLKKSFTAIVESAEGAMQWLYAHATSQNEKFNIGDLKKIVQKAKYRKEGAVAVPVPDADMNEDDL